MALMPVGEGARRRGAERSPSLPGARLGRELHRRAPRSKCARLGGGGRHGPARASRRPLKLRRAPASRADRPGRWARLSVRARDRHRHPRRRPRRRRGRLGAGQRNQPDRRVARPRAPQHPSRDRHHARSRGQAPHPDRPRPRRRARVHHRVLVGRRILRRRHPHHRTAATRPRPGPRTPNRRPSKAPTRRRVLTPTNTDEHRRDRCKAVAASGERGARPQLAAGVTRRFAVARDALAPTRALPGVVLLPWTLERGSVWAGSIRELLEPLGRSADVCDIAFDRGLDRWFGGVLGKRAE